MVEKESDSLWPCRVNGSEQGFKLLGSEKLPGRGRLVAVLVLSRSNANPQFYLPRPNIWGQLTVKFLLGN